MKRFWNWLRERLGIDDLRTDLNANTREIRHLKKKVTSKPQRYDEIERSRKRRRKNI